MKHEVLAMFGQINTPLNVHKVEIRYSNILLNENCVRCSMSIEYVSSLRMYAVCMVTVLEFGAAQWATCASYANYLLWTQLFVWLAPLIMELHNNSCVIFISLLFKSAIKRQNRKGMVTIEPAYGTIN